LTAKVPRLQSAGEKLRALGVFAVEREFMKILAVDHGEMRIGLALSDPAATIASPLAVIEHVSRPIDAAQVAALAQEHEAGLILVGQSFDEEGHPNLAGRRAARFAEALKTQTETPIILWDESLSTQDARVVRNKLVVSRKKRSGHMDDLAAALILQSYLDSQIVTHKS
jgi:putative Holliday junction resolvase